MGFITNAITQFITNPMSMFGPSIAGEKQSDGSFWYGVEGHRTEMPYDSAFQIYKNIPHVRAIVNKKTSFYSNVNFKIVNPGKGEGNEDEVNTKHELNTLLANPNFMQSWRSFLMMVGLYKNIGGIAFIHPGFGINNKPSRLAWLKPIEYEKYDTDENTHNNPITSNNMDELINKYTFWLRQGKSVTFKPSEVIAIKDSFFSYTENSTRITAAMLPITNIYKAMVNRGILMDAHGGIGMISGNQKDGGVSVPMKRSEKKKIQLNLNNYGLGHGKKPIILTDVPLRYTPMVFPTSQLMLFEEMEDDFNQLCDVFEMARELFVGDAAYASTRDAAEADTYSNTIIPEWADLFYQLNLRLNTASEGIRIDPDFSHIGCLQTDEGVELDNQIKKSAMLITELEKGIIDIDMYKQQMGYEIKKS